MSYLLKKLKEWKDCTPEQLKTNLYKEGFVDYHLDMRYEVYTFYCERLAYYNRQRITSPKMEALFQTSKAYGISYPTIYTIIGYFKS